MIKLEKGPIPQVLKDKGAEWKKLLVAKLSSGTASQADKTRYRHTDIKAALEAETHGKCAYCESKLKHIHHGDVEHIIPKSKEPQQTFEWDNLTLACEICNQNKSDKDPEDSQLLDPYVDDPVLHLMFLGPFIFPTGTSKGISTRLLLELDRAPLIERRKEKLDKVVSILSAVSRPDLPIEVRKAILKDVRDKEAASNMEFSAMVKTAVSEFVQHLPEELKARLAA